MSTTVRARASTTARYVRPLGTADEGEFAVAMTPTASNAVPGWEHTASAGRHAGAGGHVEHDSGDEETLVVPLVGSFRVEVTRPTARRTTSRWPVVRSSSTGRPTSSTPGAAHGCAITGVGPDAGRVALCGAPATKTAQPKPFRHLAASEVPVELRGAGLASREVRNFGLPDVLDADSILVCEVVTPAGNWSSWPPHKHDEERPGEETELEEIYYFETRSTGRARHRPGRLPAGLRHRRRAPLDVARRGPHR